MHNVFPQPWPTAPAHCISCDAEALDAAHRLAEVLRAGARDRIRRLPVADINAFSASGLGAITVPQAYGGPDISNVTLAEVIAIISAADAALYRSKNEGRNRVTIAAESAGKTSVMPRVSEPDRASGI